MKKALRVTFRERLLFELGGEFLSAGVALMRAKLSQLFGHFI